ncbi:MAG: dual specificity protein phosphatase family protein [Pirellulales bacterium]|nr:dual specificity protein phosphatase family protein [Pirellulales bacterium]
MRFLHWPYIACVTIGAVAAGSLTHHLMKPGDVRHEITVVNQEVLYRSGQLTADELANEIHARGIKTVINLGSRTDWDTDVCQREGVELIDMPVGDVWCICGVSAPGYDVVPEAPYDLAPFWEAIDDPERRPVLIHCWGGVHRTGVLSGIYRIQRQGWSAEDALAEMRLFGFNNRKDKFAEVAEYMHELEEEQEVIQRMARQPTSKSQIGEATNR